MAERHEYHTSVRWENQRKGTASSPDLPDLKQAKQHSDDEDYRRKNILLRTMMQADPDSWVVDSDDGNGIVGLTHTPTNFRIHMPKDRVYHKVLLRAQQQAAA